MLSVIFAILLQIKPESTSEWKKAADDEAAAVASDKFVDWSAAGESWLVAAKKLKLPTLQDRGLDCLGKAWTRSDEGNREFLRARLRKVAAPPNDYQLAPATSGAPAGWSALELGWGASIDTRFARTGHVSVKLLPSKEVPAKDLNGWSSVESTKIPVVSGKKYVASVWVFALDTDQLGDFLVSFRDASGKKLGGSTAVVPQDFPIWKKIEIRCEAPTGAVVALVRIDAKFTRGAIWADDFSMCAEAGPELMTNGGFEKR